MPNQGPDPFNLDGNIKRHPINDGPYVRHLQTADLFNEVHEAAQAHRAALEASAQRAAEARHAIRNANDARAAEQAALIKLQAAKARATLLTADALRIEEAA